MEGSRGNCTAGQDFRNFQQMPGCTPVSTGQRRRSHSLLSGLLEHADVAWIWNYSKPEQRETKVIPIQQKKVRDGELYNFDLQEEFEIMTVSNTVGSSESSSDSDAEVASNDQKPDIDFDEDAGAA